MDRSNNIRNFCIIAHIDHGKSTLADRFLDMAGATHRDKVQEQVLDSMDLEKERGITIKAKAVRLNIPYRGQSYLLNLIDTPGHVDFAYEVAKSLKGCEGAILLVDATQGVEAQTVANFNLALEEDLRIIPVLNKIDLPGADIDRSCEQLLDVFGFKRDEISCISAKGGEGIDDLLERVIKEVPAPSGDTEKPLKAILFDSLYDSYKGVVLFLRVFDGKIAFGDSILLMHQKKHYKVDEIGVFLPQPQKCQQLEAGEVGYICCSIKNPEEVDVGDTVTLSKNPVSEAFEGYTKMSPMVFCSIFPSAPKDYPSLRQAIEKLKLSDPSFTYEPDTMGSLGHGFRCGFLGLLHMEIVQARLEREFDLDLVPTSPNVMYKIKRRGETNTENVESPNHFPDPSQIDEIYEPFVKATIVCPIEGMDVLCELAKARRGSFVKMDYLGKDRLSLMFNLPLSEIIVDFYDKIKSLTKGYASFDYELTGYEKTDIVKVEFLFNKKRTEAFSLLVHKEKAEARARVVVDKFKSLIPRQMYEVVIQAAIGGRIIASGRVSALKKNVTAKCYGGDITRKRKLWEKQKKGKEKMKQLGEISVPPNAFIEVLKT